MSDFDTPAAAPATAPAPERNYWLDMDGAWPPAPPADRTLLLSLLEVIQDEAQGLKDHIEQLSYVTENPEVDSHLWAMSRLVSRLVRMAELGGLSEGPALAAPSHLVDLLGLDLTARFQRRFWADVGAAGAKGREQHVVGFDRYLRLMTEVRRIDNETREEEDTDWRTVNRVARRLDVQLQELDGAPTSERRGFLLSMAKLLLLGSESSDTGPAMTHPRDDFYFFGWAFGAERPSEQQVDKGPSAVDFATPELGDDRSALARTLATA